MRVLSFHAAYRCQDRGACCTAGWPIAVEADRLAAAEDAARRGALRAPGGSRVLFLQPAPASDAPPAVLAQAGGACVFHHATGPRACEWQRAMGHAALPLACRQFPRVSVHDPHGVSVTLSHYCPTAAAMLDDASPAHVAGDAPAFPDDDEYVGLDVRTALPPALRPDMLMDWDSWRSWENGAVELMAGVPTPDAALARLDAAVEHVRTWTPRDGLLANRVQAALDHTRATAPPPARRDVAGALVDDVIASIPQEFRGAVPAAGHGRETPRVHLNFLIAHAFANWTAHLGEGLRAWRRAIAAADALLLEGYSVGDADLLIRHLADPAELARCFSRAERE